VAASSRDRMLTPGRFTFCRHRRAATLLAAWAATCAVSAPGAQQPPTYSERVEVTRLLLDARVLDDRGEPVRGLDAPDFRVTVGGKTARVESITWVGEPVRDTAHHETPQRLVTSAAGDGRLIVFLFQKSMEPSRIVGFMRMLTEARGMLNSLTPADRVAVLSFDSRLHVWLDFTSDYEGIRRVFARGILFEKAGPVQEAPGVSLVRRLAPADARRTYTIERALRRIGEALADLPGAKSIVLVGHGFGTLGPSGVSMANEYDSMREALQEARASVFSLDVTTADYHSLEAGLQILSEQTGGFFARTHIFPTRAVRNLLGALAGHYTLFVELPALKAGVHEVTMTLPGRRANVLSRNSYVVATARPRLAQDSSCPVTVPVPGEFTPPAPYPAEPPEQHSSWYGTDALWTMLPASGTWSGLARGEAGYSQKVLLWRPGYDGRAEQWPDATVSGRRLDAEASRVVAAPATNAYRRQFGGWAMLVEVEIPTPGCWELRATDGTTTLTFTVLVMP
jgi:VWFA-related protein